MNWGFTATLAAASGSYLVGLLVFVSATHVEVKG
jgi:hypothetical protein